MNKIERLQNKIEHYKGKLAVYPVLEKQRIEKTSERAKRYFSTLEERCKRKIASLENKLEKEIHGTP